MPIDAKLLGQMPAVRPIAEHHGRLGWHALIPNRPQQRQRGFGAHRGADRQPRPLGALFGRPNANRKLLRPADLDHRGAQARQLGRRQLDPQQHGEETFFVVIIHLDLGDIGAQTGDMMDDRIGQSTVIGPNRGENDLHGFAVGRTGTWNRSHRSKRTDTFCSQGIVRMSRFPSVLNVQLHNVL